MISKRNYFLLFVVFSALAPAAFAETRLSGRLGNTSGLEESKILTLDKGVVVRARVSVNGDQATYMLRSPNGSAIRLLDKERGPVIRGVMTEHFEFRVPQSGKVRFSLQASKNNKAVLEYFFTFQRRVELAVSAEAKTVKTGKKKQRAIVMKAHLVKDDGSLIPRRDAKVAANIQFPNRKSQTVRLRDDGKSEDGRAGDGVYGYVLKTAPQKGQYKIAALLVITKNEQRFSRKVEKVVTLK